MLISMESVIQHMSLSNVIYTVLIHTMGFTWEFSEGSDDVERKTWGDPNLHATLLSHEWSRILNFRPYPCPENGVSPWKPLSEMVSLCLCMSM